MIIIYYRYYIMHHCVFEMQEWDVSPASLLRAAELGDADELRRQLGKAWRQETHHGDPWKFDMVLYDFILWFDPVLCGLLFMDFYCGFGLCFLVTQHDLAWPEPALFFSWKRNHGGLPQLAPMEKFGTAAMNFKEATLYSMHSLLMVVMFLEVLVEHQQPKDRTLYPLISRHSPSSLQGADVAWSDADGLQGLHWAARQGQTAALQVLLEAGANAEGRCLGGSGWHNWAQLVLCFFWKKTMPDKLRKYTTYNIDLLIYDILIYSYICWYLRAVSHAAVWFFHEPRAAAEPIRRPRKRSPKMITERSRFEGSKCFALGSNLWTFGGIRGTSDLHWTWAGNLGMCRKNKYALAIWKIPEKRNMFNKKIADFMPWTADLLEPALWEIDSSVLQMWFADLTLNPSESFREERKLHPSVYSPEIPLQVLLEKIPVEEWQPTVQKHAFSSEATKRQPE